MKKTTIGIIVGVCVLIVCTFFALVLFNPFGKEDLQAGNNIETENSENVDDTVVIDTQESEETETESMETELPET